MIARRKHPLATTMFVVALVIGIGATSQASATCTQHQDVTTVCAGGACWTNIYYYESCTTSGGGGDGGGGTPGSGPGGGGGSFYDQDGNGIVDEWHAVISTADPCANNFDTNDRLGTNYGGSNTIRPGHSGVDLQANWGDGIYPFRSGTVSAVGWAGDCGYRVTVQHDDGSWAAYCHMVDASSSLQTGAYVRAGLNLLGQVNSTGNSSGDHLHLTFGSGDERYEYFMYTNSQPTSAQLQAGGC